MSKGLERHIIPDISMEGLSGYLDRIAESGSYSNFGPLSIELEEKVGCSLSLSDKLGVACVSSAHSAFETLGIYFNTIGRNKVVALFDVSFWTQYIFAERFFENAIVFPVDGSLLPDINYFGNNAKLNEIDALVITATYGRDISASVRILRRLLPDDTPIIVDAANAFNTFKIESLPNVFVVISLHATKNFGVGEGGLIICDQQIKKDVKQIQNFGLNGDRSRVMDGHNSKFSEFHAAIGLINLPRVTNKLDILDNISQSITKELDCLDINTVGRTSLMVCIDDEELKSSIEDRFKEARVATHDMYISRNQILSSKFEIRFSRRDLKKHWMGIPFHTFLKEDDVAQIISLFKQFRP